MKLPDTDHAIESDYRDLIDLLAQLELTLGAGSREARSRAEQSARIDGPIQEIDTVQ